MREYIETILNKSNINPNAILEIGSRDGHDSSKLQNYFNVLPNNVWVVEPNPKQAEQIKKTYPKFNLLETAISSSKGTAEFNCVEETHYVGVSSILDRNDGFYNNVLTKKIIVNTITGNQLMETISMDIDLCKIDVEGLTYEVLKSFDNSIHKIKSLHLECEHKEIWKNQKLFSDIEKLLKLNGFKMCYFMFVGNEKNQSDSIWINPNCIK